MSLPRTVRIGCRAGFWSDSPERLARFVQHEKIGLLMLGYLAEVTMSILARMKADAPAIGYAMESAT